MSVISSVKPTVPIHCLIQYAIEHPSPINLDQIRPFFSNLIPDPYLEGTYRSRRFSQFEIQAEKIIQLPHTTFLQSKTYNPLLGDIVREYEELESALVELPDFHRLLLDFYDFCQPCSASQKVGVHQIRITTTHDEIGNPAPEGIHQDGVDVVGIFCVSRVNIQGGETLLFAEKSSPPILKKILNPGELLVINDQDCYHFATPIEANSKAAGFRDVFVLTCPEQPFPGWRS